MAKSFELNSDKVFERSVKLFSHIINVQQVWNNRMVSKEKLFGLWEVHPIQDFKSKDTSNNEYTLYILERFNIDKTFSYSNSKGRTFENKIKDVLFYILNHTTYHRGQIATEFRKNDIESLVTNYLFYKR